MVSGRILFDLEPCFTKYRVEFSQVILIEESFSLVGFIDKPTVFDYLSNSSLDFLMIFDERINFNVIIIEPVFPLLSLLSKSKGGSFLEAFLEIIPFLREDSQVLVEILM